MLYNIALYGMTMGAPAALVLLRFARFLSTGIWPTINLITVTGYQPTASSGAALMSIPLEIWLIILGLTLSYGSRR